MPNITCKTYLVELENLLKHHSLWSEQSPSDQALTSTAPFACDTLSFEQWLQFIFMPKMTQLIDCNQALPTQMHLAPMAEQVWQGNGNYQDIISLLSSMDEFIND
jgi:uncharacterized protein YqcC (DUF446 family)